MDSKKQKVVLVTGASSGMGKVIAKRVLKDGMTVIAVARSIDKMQDLMELGANATALDVTDEEGVAKAVADINGNYGGVDAVVNNAGFGLYGAIEDVTIDEARYQFEVNLFGVARITRLVLPNMREKGAGKIINISSMGGKMYTPLGGWYHASKHALEGWSDCLRLEVAQFGIDVIIIEPGVIQTDFGSVLLEPMLKRSGDGAYRTLARNVAKVTKNSYKDGGGSKPEVIASVVSSAIKARNPRTRYVAGKYAKPLIWMRKYLGDRVFDRIVMSAVT
jgi:short-subunit dehydrogenase